MYILGDIGNTETKLCIVSKNNKISKKISGILQEVIFVRDKKFLITGIGINIKKNPIIRNYPATNLQEVTKKSISKLIVENKLKQLFEKNLSKLYKIK